MERYQDLALEVKRIHRTTKKTVIAIVIDALELSQRMQGLVWEDQSAGHFSAQLSAILGSAHILQKAVVSLSSGKLLRHMVFSKLFKPP